MQLAYVLAPKYSELFEGGFWFSREHSDALITGSLRVLKRGTAFQTRIKPITSRLIAAGTQGHSGRGVFPAGQGNERSYV
jgi:hypothetical protein